MTMLSLLRYTADRQSLWDAFVKESKNGTFLFERAYMNYHSDRFADHSLMYFDARNRLLGLLPANEREGILYSHQGLTYGGLILSKEVRTAQVLDMMQQTMEYLRQQGFTTWRYKQMPTCYHRVPSEEDSYALWRVGATICASLVSTTIPLYECLCQPEVERRRRRGRHRAEEAGYCIIETDQLTRFWAIMTQNLDERYGVKPVHSQAEMAILMGLFPQQIRLFGVAKDGEEAEAGCVVYEANDHCVHIQYGHATPQGKRDGCLDLLYLSLVERYSQQGVRYLDFGNSNEQGGHYLNENLIAQKEGFGGRAVVYNQYEIKL